MVILPKSGAEGLGTLRTALTPTSTSAPPVQSRAEPFACGKSPISSDRCRKSRRPRPSSRKSSATPCSVYTISADDGMARYVAARALAHEPTATVHATRTLGDASASGRGKTSQVKSIVIRSWGNVRHEDYNCYSGNSRTCRTPQAHTRQSAPADRLLRSPVSASTLVVAPTFPRRAGPPDRRAASAIYLK